MAVKADQTQMIFKAFADPTRLRILNILSLGEFCVCELMEVLGLSQPKISRHLGYLRRAGLIRGRKAGVWVHYSLESKELDRLKRGLMACVKGCLRQMPILMDDAARAGNVRRRRKAICR